MNAAQAVLDTLDSRLGPEQRSAALARILRVPAAWRMLLDPDFLSAFRAAELPAELAPTHLASLALGAQLDVPIGPQLASRWAEQSGVAWKAFLASPLTTAELPQLALLALEFTLQDDLQRTIQMALEDPASWRDVLALAWMGHPQRERILGALAGDASARGLGLAVHIALANLPPEQAARQLLTADPASAYALTRYLRDRGENALAATLLQAAPTASSGLQQRLLHSERSIAQGDRAAALAALQAAWDDASGTAAEIADRMMSLATEQGDPVLALETARQALENQPTPQRRADYALALLRLGRAHDALSSLPAETSAPEELIALGIVLSELGQPEAAQRTLGQAAQAVSAEQAVSDRWYGELGRALSQIDAMETAVQVARLRAERSPANAQARDELIRALEAVGDPEAAARHARLAITLEPESSHGQLALARNLVKSGDAASALPHWEALVSNGAGSLVDLGRCALAAGEIERAEAAAAKLLEQEHASTDAAILAARCLIARGDYPAAEAHLREIVSGRPDHLEARLLLAEALALAGQEQAAGEVLYAAVQALPHELPAAIALSSWLRSQGRPSEAAQIANTALHASPHDVEALVEYGEAALQIGDHQQALQAFAQAARRQPGNWQARIGLARAHERLGDLIAAAQRIGAVPKSATATSLIDAARITILAAEASQNVQGIPAAVKYLKRASRQSPGDPSIELWTARAQEVAGRADEALAGYQRCLARFASEDADSYAAALLGIGRTAMTTGEIPLALSTLEQAQIRFPTSCEIQCLLSQAYASANLPEKAVKAAERAIEIDGGHAGAWETLGRARAAVGDMQGALQAYHGLSSVQPEDAQGWVELAELARASDAREVMRTALAEALWRGRRSPQVLGTTAEILESVGSQRSALRLLRMACAMSPEDRPILRRLAELSEQADDLESAHQAWAQLAKLEPQDSRPLLKSAQALWGLGRCRPAIEAWQRALQLEPRNPQLRRALGKAYMQLGEVQHGLNHYTLAIELDPADPVLKLEAGISAMRSGAHREAVGLLSAAVDGDPASAEAWSALGECRVLLGEWGEAATALARAAELGAVPPRVGALRVITSLSMGDLGGAAELLDQAHRAPPTTAADAIWLARASLRMGHWTVAIRSLRSWMRGAQDPAAEQALAEIRLALLEARWVCEQAEAEAFAPESNLLAESEDLLLGQEVNRLRAQALLDPPKEAVLQAMRSALEANPGGESAHSLAIGWLRAGEPQAALQVAAAGQPRAYDFDWQPLLQGIAFRELGRLEEALEALEIGAQDPVLRPLSEAMQAGIHAAVGELEAAIAVWNRALAARPGESRWHHSLATLYFQHGAAEAGLPHLQQAVELAPADMTLRLQLARGLAACGHSAEAVEAFGLATDRIELSLDDLLQAGAAALDSQAPDQAADWHERALAVDPQHPGALVGAARAAMACGKVRQARERIDAALRAAPGDPLVHLGQGEILAMQRDFRGALQAYERVRGAQGTTKSRLIQAKSEALLALGQVEHAEQVLLEQLEQLQQDPNLWYPLAMVRESKGELESAAEAAGQAVRLAPLNPGFRLALARICRQSGNLDRALDELARAEELAPGDPRIPLAQGGVYEDRRDYRRALECYRRAIELDKGCLQAYFRSGMVLKMLKSYPQAGQMLKRAAQLAPVDREVMHQLAAVRALELVHGPSAGVPQ